MSFKNATSLATQVVDGLKVLLLITVVWETTLVLSQFFLVPSKNSYKKKTKSRTKAFSTFFGVKSSENKDSFCEKDPEPLKKQMKKK